MSIRQITGGHAGPPLHRHKQSKITAAIAANQCYFFCLATEEITKEEGAAANRV